MVTSINPGFNLVEMEFDNYLIKPMTREQLHETIEELLTLTAYDERIQEYYALSAKRTTLKTNRSSDDVSQTNRQTRPDYYA